MTPSIRYRAVWGLVNAEQRRAGGGLLLLMIVGMVLETLGVGLVIPTLGVLVQADPAAKLPMLAPLLQRLPDPSRETMAVAGMLLLVVVFTIKTLFLGFLEWRKARFVNRMQVDLAHRLFIGYLRQPYTFHLQRNSSQLILNVANETGVFAQTALTSVLLLVTETLVLVGISALLLKVEPVGAVIVSVVLGLAVWGFGRVTNKRVLLWGENRQGHDIARFRHLQQGLGGVKDVKLLGREDEFLALYQANSAGSARAGELQTTLGQLPRLWLELLAVTGLAGLVLVMVWRGRPLDLILPTLGLFGAAAFRLMPSVNRVVGALQNVRYSRPAVEMLAQEFALIADAPVITRGERMPFMESLTLEGVGFQYPGAESDALRAVTLRIPRGASVGFIGSSGAGKSTLVDIILGLLTPTTGVVRVDGTDVQRNLRGWQDEIGYVPQSIYLTDDTLRRNVAFGLADSAIDDAAVQRAITAAQLDEFVADLPSGLETMVGERGVRLSGGQRQRIGIARALYHDPAVLVLDEATSALDTETERSVMDAVRALQGKKTLIIIAHRLSTVAHCDRLFRLDRGNLVEEGEAAAVLRQTEHRPEGSAPRAGQESSPLTASHHHDQR